MRLIRPATGEICREFKRRTIVHNVAFDPAGDFIASGWYQKLCLDRIPEAGSTRASSLPSILEYECDKAGNLDYAVFAFHPTMNAIACVNMDKKAPFKLRFLAMPESSEAPNNNNGTHKFPETPEGKKREGSPGGPSAEKAPKRSCGEKAA